MLGLGTVVYLILGFVNCRKIGFCMGLAATLFQFLLFAALYAVSIALLAGRVFFSLIKTKPKSKADREKYDEEETNLDFEAMDYYAARQREAETGLK